MSRMFPHGSARLSARPLALVFLTAFVLAPGCDTPEPITVYTVPTKVPEQLQVGKERMLAAMIPKGDQVWFFKVTGPEDAIGSIESTYRKFVESIEIEEGGTPNLKDLPDGWRMGGKKAMRFASIDVDTPEKQLDISISQLGRQDDWDNFVVINVNRWRGQLGLPASSEKWAGGEPMEVTTADATSVWVDLLGKTPASGSMSSPPFANRAPPAAAEKTSPPVAAASPPADSPLKFKRPESWRDGRMSSMRLAAFNVGPQDAEAEITVIPAGGDLRGNVARWLGQIRGEGVPDEVVDKALADAQKIEVDGRPGQRYLLTSAEANEGDAIDVTIVPLEDGISLFIKMQGPATTVQAQSEEIASFLASLKLEF